MNNAGTLLDMVTKLTARQALGEVLRQEIEGQGFKIAGFAKLIERDRGTLYNVFHGEETVLLQTYRTICAHLKIPVDTIEPMLTGDLERLRAIPFDEDLKRRLIERLETARLPRTRRATDRKQA